MDVNLIRNNITPVTQVYNSDTAYQNNENTDTSVVDKVENIDNKKNEIDKNKENKENKNQYNKKDLDKALKKLNKFLEDERTRAEYSVHKDLGTIMIKVIDEDTNKVILEIPPKKILDMVASMCKEFGIIDKKA